MGYGCKDELTGGMRTLKFWEIGYFKIQDDELFDIYFVKQYHGVCKFADQALAVRFSS